MNAESSLPAEIKRKLEAAIAETIAYSERERREEDSAFTRKSELTKERMIKLLLSMNGGNLEKELYKAGVSAGKSAFSQRRSQLCSLEFEDILERFNQSERNIKTYKGYRVLAVDGTTVNMPRDPKSQTFVQNAGTPKGYNQFHVNPLYDVLNKTYQHCVIQPQPQQDEVGALRFMLDWYDFPAKTLIVADRGYESYNLIAHFLENRVHFLIRVKQDRSAMREIRKLPMATLDTDVSFTITTTQTNEDKAKGHILLQIQKNENRIYSPNTRAKRWDHPSPYPMKFRVVRFMLNTGEYETLITSLKRGSDGFSLKELKELYHARWGIETAFRELEIRRRFGQSPRAKGRVCATRNLCGFDNVKLLQPHCQPSGRSAAKEEHPRIQSGYEDGDFPLPGVLCRRTSRRSEAHAKYRQIYGAGPSGRGRCTEYKSKILERLYLPGSGLNTRARIGNNIHFSPLHPYFLKLKQHAFNKTITSLKYG